MYNFISLGSVMSISVKYLYVQVFDVCEYFLTGVHILMKYIVQYRYICYTVCTLYTVQYCIESTEYSELRVSLDIAIQTVSSTHFFKDTYYVEFFLTLHFITIFSLINVLLTRS